MTEALNQTLAALPIPWLSSPPLCSAKALVILAGHQPRDISTHAHTEWEYMHLHTTAGQLDSQRGKTDVRVHLSCNWSGTHTHTHRRESVHE